MSKEQFESEGWILIPGYEKLYAFRVSDDIPGGQVLAFEKFRTGLNGSIIRIPEKIKQHVLDSDGYLRTTLCKDGVQKTWALHQISAFIHLPNPQNKPHVNHKFGIKTDNRPSQIEWATIKENNQHMHRTGLMVNDKGAKDSQSIPVIQLTMNGEVIAEHESICIAGKVSGVHKGSITKVLKGGRHHAGNFKWKYKN